MKNALRISLGLVITCLMAACQTAGNGHAFSTSATTLNQQLQPGRTTQAEVLREFGQASVYRFANGFEAWTYQQTQGVPKFVSFLPVVGLLAPALPDRTDELALLFDTKGVLCKVDLRAAVGRH